ncbi:MAG: phage/plasmid primase, P4 family [Promethearchaeota archaeon]
MSDHSLNKLMKFFNSSSKKEDSFPNNDQQTDIITNEYQQQENINRTNDNNNSSNDNPLNKDELKPHYIQLADHLLQELTKKKQQIDSMFTSNNIKKIDLINDIAEYIQFAIPFKRMQHRNILFWYDASKGIWESTGESVIKNFCALFRNLIKHDYNEIYNRILYSAKTIKPTTFIESEKIALLNGSLNLRTGEITPFNPNDYLTIQIPVTYQQEASYEHFKQFIIQLVGEEQEPLIQKLFGYLLLPHYQYSRTFMLVGSGSNGKSTLLQIITAFLGKNNCTSVKLQQQDHSFSRARLFNKMANLVGELPNKTVTYTAFFKESTGNDLMHGRLPYRKEGIDFVNRAKFIFSMNEPPLFHEDTDAIWRRIIKIDFMNTFEGSNDNPNIVAELTTGEGLSQIFNYALAGLHRIYHDNGFPEMSIMNTRTNYLTETNTILLFIETRKITENYSSAKTDYNEVYRSYAEYCKSIDKIPRPKQTFTKYLPRYITTAELHRSGDEKYWLGITLQS